MGRRGIERKKRRREGKTRQDNTGQDRTQVPVEMNGWIKTSAAEQTPSEIGPHGKSWALVSLGIL
jgi:hypothetical protein